MDNQELKRLYEEVKHLREDNLGIPISTTNALRYVRSQIFYEGLRKEIDEIVSPQGIRFNPTLRELSDLCHGINRTVRDMLDAITNNTTLEANKTTYSPRRFYIQEANPQLDKYETKSEDFETDYGYRKYNFDYIKFLNDYAIALGQTRNKQEAIRLAFEDLVMNNKQYLIGQDGERISYSEFKQMTNLHLSPNTTPEEDLEKWRRDLENSIEFNPEITQWITISCPDYFNDSSPYGPGNLTEEEIKFRFEIYSKRHKYDRAKEERLLGRIQTERQIAVEEIYSGGEDSIEERIDGKVEIIKGSIKNNRAFIKRLLQMGKKEAYPLIVNARELENRYFYTIRALKTNRRWLIEFLSR